MMHRPLIKRLAIVSGLIGCFVGLCGFGGDISPIPFFPAWQTQNDALCQGYGYEPGTRLYALCRERKDRISHDLHAQSFPDVTPIPLMLLVDPHKTW